MNRTTREEAIDILQRARSSIPQLRLLPLSIQEFGLGSLKIAVCPQEFFTWHTDTSLSLNHVFGENFQYSQEFSNILKLINPTPLNPSTDLSDSVNERANDYFRMLDKGDSLLLSLLKYVYNYWKDSSQASTSSNARFTNAPTTNEVFVVHGRDEGVKNTVARFLENLGLRPVVLAEQPSRGLTIIEKFERHAQVAFAVVLLTEDDVGSLRSETERRPRARQNVIFELGFFIGRLDRGRVCALTKDDPEIPSDYAGVSYIPIDEAGGWQMNLMKELKAAGFNVDANRVIRT